MTSASTEKSPAGPSTGRAAAAPATQSPLQSGQGSTQIAENVVSKIAGLSAREVHGVHELGGGAAIEADRGGELTCPATRGEGVDHVIDAKDGHVLSA